MAVGTENGIVVATREGSLQGGNLSPLLANIYLDKFDKEFEGRGVKVIRYADDILLLANSIRAAERLLETSTRYLEKKLKLKRFYLALFFVVDIDFLGTEEYNYRKLLKGRWTK